MGETLLLILLFVIMAVIGLANSNYDKDRDDYMSGEDGNDHHEG
jgi:Na+/proline symporter